MPATHATLRLVSNTHAQQPVPWRSSTLTSIYSCQSTKRPQMQQHKNYNPSATTGPKVLIYYKLTSLQLGDLPSGAFLCMSLHDCDTRGILWHHHSNGVDTGSNGMQITCSYITHTQKVSDLHSFALECFTTTHLMNINRIHLSYGWYNYKYWQSMHWKLWTLNYKINDEQ